MPVAVLGPGGGAKLEIMRWGYQRQALPARLTIYDGPEASVPNITVPYPFFQFFRHLIDRRTITGRDYI